MLKWLIEIQNHSHLAQSSHMRCKKACSITSIQPVRQMSRGDDQRPITNQVTQRTVNFGLTRRITRNLASVLQIASKPKQHHSLDLRFHLRGQLLDRVVDDSRSLTKRLLTLDTRMKSADCAYTYIRPQRSSHWDTWRCTD